MKRVAEIIADDGDVRVTIKCTIDGREYLVSGELARARQTLIRAICAALPATRLADFGADNIRVTR